MQNNPILRDLNSLDFVDMTLVDEECFICTKTFTKSQQCGLPCQHKFHSRCIKAWVNVKFNCPLCRAKVTDSDIRKI